MFCCALLEQDFQGIHDSQQVATEVQEFLVSYLRLKTGKIVGQGSHFEVEIVAGGNFVSLSCAISHLNNLLKTSTYFFPITFLISTVVIYFST